MEIDAVLDFGDTLRRGKNVGQAYEGARALVPLAPSRPASSQPAAGISSCPAPDTRAAAAFLSQLIATAQGAPQTRTHRRADPDRVIAVYAAAMRPAAPQGQVIRAAR